MNPEQSLAFPAVPVSESETPLMFVGAGGTNLPRIKLSSSIELSTLCPVVRVNAPPLKLPDDGVPRVKLPPSPS